MEREPARSSNIKSVGYDEEQMLLEVEFHSGSVYQYSGVPQSVWLDWKETGFTGGHFIGKIREGYQYERIE